MGDDFKNNMDKAKMTFGLRNEFEGDMFKQVETIERFLLYLFCSIFMVKRYDFFK